MPFEVNLSEMAGAKEENGKEFSPNLRTRFHALRRGNDFPLRDFVSSAKFLFTISRCRAIANTLHCAPGAQNYRQNGAENSPFEIMELEVPA
jgi:hypothetical protein